MREVTDSVRRLAMSWRGDAALAAILLAWALAYTGIAGRHASQSWTAVILAMVFAASLAIRRRWPLAAAVIICAALLTVRPLGLDHTLSGSLAIFSWTPFLLAYALATGAGLVSGLMGVVLLIIGLQVENQVFNPFFEMITVGPWLAGRVVMSRRRLTWQLEARNAELQAERERFALESVRYERARIARELHDIVAHCVSVIVVQAGAGQRLPAADRDGTAAAFGSIAEAASQAQTEIGRLAGLLGAEPAISCAGVAMIGELARRASLAGLAVDCRLQGACDRLAPAAADAAYRVVQEAVTNALKHAPGAPVAITVSEKGGTVRVSVVNTAPRDRPSGLEQSGGGHGLAGMRHRVAACGGSCTAGPAPAGGWEVSALLPARPAEPLEANAATRAPAETGESGACSVPTTAALIIPARELARARVAEGGVPARLARCQARDSAAGAGQGRLLPRPSGRRRHPSRASSMLRAFKVAGALALGGTGFFGLFGTMTVAVVGIFGAIEVFGAIGVLGTGPV